MNWERPESDFIGEMTSHIGATTNPEKAWEAMLWALNDGFPFLTYPQIKTPPKKILDAAMVRQLGLYLCIHHLGIPKKRMAGIAGVSREIHWRSGPLIKARLKNPKFREHAERVLAQALENMERMNK